MTDTTRNLDSSSSGGITNYKSSGLQNRGLVSQSRPPLSSLSPISPIDSSRALS